MRRPLLALDVALAAARSPPARRSTRARLDVRAADAGAGLARPRRRATHRPPRPRPRRPRRPVPAPSGGGAGRRRRRRSRRSTSRSSRRRSARPPTRRSRSTSTTRTRVSRTTSRSRTRSGRSMFKGDIVTGAAGRGLPGPRAAGRHVPVRLHGAPEHDGHAHGRRLSDGARDDRARRRGLLPRRLRPLGRGPRARGGRGRRAAARRPRHDRVLPGRRRPAVGPGRDPARRGRPTWTVRAARRVGGEIVHELEPPEDGELPAAGDLVRVDLEWARRYALMRTHTALHALCGVVWRDYGALVTGGNMEPGSGPHGLRVRDDVAATSSTRSRRRSTRSCAPPATSASTCCRATRRSRSRT